MIEDLLDSFDFSFKWILIGFNFITIIFLYLHQRNNKRQIKHSVLLVTAHPDDESMFFRPTITSLVSDYYVHLLCLSGASTSREKELQQASAYLKIHKVKCVNSDKLVDGMKEKWCEDTIRELVLEYVRSNDIRAVFTFDSQGVSGHCNHEAIYHALKPIQVPEPQKKQKKDQTKQVSTSEAKKEEQKMAKDENKRSSIKIYFLQSTNLLRKYSGLLQTPIVLLQTFSWLSFSPFETWGAMSRHESQFVWYRKLWVLVSRYSYINTFSRSWIKISQ